MVIFHSFLLVYQRVSQIFSNQINSSTVSPKNDRNFINPQKKIEMSCTFHYFIKCCYRILSGFSWSKPFRLRSEVGLIFQCPQVQGIPGSWAHPPRKSHRPESPYATSSQILMNHHSILRLTLRCVAGNALIFRYQKSYRVCENKKYPHWYTKTMSPIIVGLSHPLLIPLNPFKSH